MAWVVLVLAGIFEVGWAVCLKYAKGFTQVWPTVGFVVFTVASVGLLGVAMKRLPLGTAYTVWTGIGAIGTVAYGIAFFGEPAGVARLGCIALIVAGLVGLKMLTPG